MNVFVRERAHQSAVAWCLHQCVQGPPHQSIIWEAPSSFQKEKKISHQSAVEKAQHLMRSFQGLFQFLEKRKKWEGGKVPLKASSLEFFLKCGLHYEPFLFYIDSNIIKHYLDI